MEVILPVNTPDFDFNSSLYASAPSTPKLLGECYFSAPNSPTRRIPELDLEFDDHLIEDETSRNNNLASVPFAWEEKPGVPKSVYNSFNDEFAFDVSGHNDERVENERAMQERGRDRTSYNTSSSRSRRTRSLPPVRGLEQPQGPTNPNTTPSTALTASGSGKGSKKWSFMDFFLFRSASDGRAMDNDPLKKYSEIFRKHDEDIRHSSFRDPHGSGSSKRRGKVSAHELHYTVNRAVSNDMKKKTFLPYKQGILGRLAFNPTVHALSNGFGFSHHQNNN
nr:hypothetical protein [Tanacetum cinerariifolium]